MIEHKLGFQVLDTNNPLVFNLLDESVYTSEMPYICPEILITAPGFQFSSRHVPTQNFNLTLTACNLEIQVRNCDAEMNTIPDGIYAIKYSVSPAEYVFVEKNHLRQTIVKNRIGKIYGQLDLPTSQLPEVKKTKLVKLNEVENYLKAARECVEIKGDSKRGMELFNYALKLLDRIDCKHC